MRIYFKIKTTNKIVPFDHQPLLTGTIHKWLGWNNVHGNVSLYSFSWLEGGKKAGTGLRFEKETSFFFSSYKSDLIKKMVTGIQNDPNLFNGFMVSEIIIQEEPDFSNRELFFTASPIFIKRKVGNEVDHIRYDDPRASAYLKETLQTKMKRAGINNNMFNIRFDLKSPYATTKKITYNGVQNRANWCPVIIEGNVGIKQFAWNVGLGNSTGIGFGAIK